MTAQLAMGSRVRRLVLVLAAVLAAALLVGASTRAPRAMGTSASLRYVYDHTGAQKLGTAHNWEAGLTWTSDGQAQVVNDPKGAYGQVAKVYVRGYGHGTETSWVRGTLNVPADADVAAIPLATACNGDVNATDSDAGMEISVYHQASGRTVKTYASHLMETDLGVDYVVAFADVSEFQGKSVQLTITLRQPDVCAGTLCTQDVDLYVGDLWFERLPDICTTEADGSHTLYHYYDDPTPKENATCGNPQEYYFIDVEKGPYNHYHSGQNTYDVNVDLPSSAEVLQFKVYYGYKSHGFTFNGHALDAAQTYAAFPIHLGGYVNIAEPSRWMPFNDNPDAVSDHLVAGNNKFSFNVYTEKVWEERHFDLWARFRVPSDSTAPSITNVTESDDPIYCTYCPEPTDVTIRADVTDDESGIEWVRLYYTVWQWQPCYFTMRHESGGPYKSPLIGSTGPATLEYYVKARDKAGNEAQSPSYTVTIKGCPSIRGITAQGVGTTDDKPETGSVVRLEADIDVPAGYELARCSWTGDLTPGQGDTTNNCRYEYTPATGAGPDVNTYGEKDVTLTIAYTDTATGASAMVSGDHTYKVFFEKTGDDDGDGDPNWFEYWGDDGAVDGLDSADVLYDSTCPIGYICYGSWRHPPNDNVYVKDGAAGTHYPNGIDVPAVAGTCPGGSFGGADGIDCAAEVLTHELRHKEIYHNWDTASTVGSCGDAAGPWSGCTDSDTGTTHGRPGDDLPDDYETAVGTDPNDVDSCDMATAKGVASYAQYGDNEFNVMVLSDGETGDADNDWANPGKLASAACAPCAAARAKDDKPRWKSGPAGHNAPYGEFTCPAATTLGGLTGDYGDEGIDTDGDGQHDGLELSVGVQIEYPTAYYVLAWLRHAPASELAWASAGATLDPGTHTIEPVFDGRLIRASGHDGPYDVSRVELRVIDDDSLVDAADDAHTTDAYERTDFDPPDVAFSGSFSDTGVDSGTDGLYDLLRISVGIDVEKGDTYSVIGELEGSAAIAVARETASLAKGSHSVDLDFDGQSIFQHRKNGPYHLRKLRIEDASGTRIDFIYDAHATADYGYDEFQHRGTTLNAGSYTDQGVDTDGDAPYELLRVQLQVNADQAGAYRLVAALQDTEGETIATVAEDADLIVGNNAVSLDFPGSVISAHGVDGPYQVASVALLSRDGAIVDHQRMAHITAAYACTDFEQLFQYNLPMVTN